MRTSISWLLTLSILLLLGSCTGQSGGGSGGNVSDDNVQAALEKLNIDTTPTPRIGGDGNNLPDTYTPLGKSRTLAPKQELFLAGMGLASADDSVNLLKFLPGVSNVPGQSDEPDSMTSLPESDLDQGWRIGLNHAVSGDVDGDGQDEIIVVWWNPDGNDLGLRVKVLDDETESFAESPVSVLAQITPDWLTALSADFDGDGTDDVALAYSDDRDGNIGVLTLLFLTGSKTGGYAVDDQFTRTIDATQATGFLGIEWAAGQMDRDAGEELAFVVNEVWGSGTNQSPGNGRSDYWVLDDQNAGFTSLVDGERVQADVSTDTYNAVVGNVALGDSDGDGLHELFLAGLTDFSVNCERLDTLLIAFDDADADFALLGAAFNNEQGPSSCETSGNNGHTEHLWMGALDIDGDQYDEIAVNGMIFESLDEASPFTLKQVETGPDDQEEAIVPFDYLFKSGPGNNQRAQVGRASIAIAYGDVTADGNEDIIVVGAGPVDVGDQTSGSSTFDITEVAVTVWGIDPLTGRWGKNDITGSEGHIGMLYFEVLDTAPSNTNGSGKPLIVPANVDTDSTSLKYSEGSYQLIFSEPIVHAALAAPPCYDDGTQNSSDCKTSWGTGTSQGVNASVSHEISVKQHTGVSGDVSLPLVGSVGVEMEQTVGVSLKAEASYGYELTKTVTYTTGAMEDTVVATVIPYDQYRYEILSHPVYPDLVGEEVVISLPRVPRTFQLNRSFYNDNLVEGDPKIDGTVFQHTIGQPDSYPTRLDMLQATNAKSIGPQDVGASGGSQTVSISESQVAGFSSTLSVSYETTVKATGGKVMRGYSVGSTSSATLGVSMGSQVTFTGTVGDMPPDTFDIDRAYSFGMFVYKQSIYSQDRPFQVINYWVE